MDPDFLVSFPGLGIEDIPISRVAFSIFGLDVYWYGIIITLGILLSMFLAYREAPKFKINQDFLLDNYIGIIIGALVGARAFYVAFSWDKFKDDPMKIFDIRQGGMAFYGGLIGAIIVMLILHKVKDKSIIKMWDFIVVYLPLGQAIGRWGNFINQEAFGENTDLPWGMISNGTKNYLENHPELMQNPNLPVHPTFLYESIGNLILFFILHWYRKKTDKKGSVVAVYFMGYGINRFFVEGLRTDSLYVGNTSIRVSQLISGILFILGLIYFIIINIYDKKKSQAKADKVFLDYEAKAAQADTVEPAVEQATTTTVEKDAETGELEKTTTEKVLETDEDETTLKETTVKTKVEDTEDLDADVSETEAEDTDTSSEE